MLAVHPLSYRRGRMAHEVCAGRPSQTSGASTQRGERGGLAFARKASGLVRGLSMVDAFAVGMMNQGITPSIWTMITWGLGTYLSGNLFWASIISLVLVGFGFPLVWGILSGSMPRSGGEYMCNSRIIHPIVGIAESFGLSLIMIFWVYVLAPWIACLLYT